MSKYDLRKIWNAFLSCRSHPANVENFYLTFIGMLSHIKQHIRQHYEQSNPPIDYPKLFISYAWPNASKEHPDCQRMHTLLRFLEAIIEYLTGGREQVFFDLGNMQGNFRQTMRRNLAASQFVLLIGTQKLKTRVTNQPESNIGYEFQQIVARMLTDPQANFLMPVMLEGDYSTAFPGSTISQGMVYDCSSGLLAENLSVAGLRQLMTAIFSLSGPRGIVPIVFDIEGKRRTGYSSLVDSIENSLQILGETGAPVMAAVGGQGLFPPTVTANDRVNRRAEDVRMSCQVSPEEVNGVLNAVGRGNIGQVTNYLDRNPALCYVQGIVKDVANRCFNKITVFQYALWAGDIPMCQAILERLPQEDAANQMNALEHHRPDIGNTHGTYFTFEPTINAYKTYCDNHNDWDYNQCTKYWCETIGGFQKTWPAWVCYKMSEVGDKVAWIGQNISQTYSREPLLFGLKDGWFVHRSNQLGAPGSLNGFAWERWMASVTACLHDRDSCEAFLHHHIEAQEALSKRLRFQHPDADHLNIEHSAIVSYRESLRAQFAALFHGSDQGASQSPR